MTSPDAITGKKQMFTKRFCQENGFNNPTRNHQRQRQRHDVVSEGEDHRWWSTYILTSVVTVLKIW